MKTFKNGLLTGLALQLAIGPVFFYIINLTLQKTTLDGLIAVIGVTLGDYVYITLAILGIGELLKKDKIKKIFGIISSTVLILFGIFIIKNIIGANILNNTVDINSTSLFSSFISTFVLTISSPLTIVLFTSLFASKVIENNYNKKELFIFGFSTGLATLLFMGISVIIFSWIKGSVPILLIQILNFIVGCLLIGYGGIRLIKNLKSPITNSYSKI
jgi:threonine/homoserine/homoserine lactone efflux protein